MSKAIRIHTDTVTLKDIYNIQEQSDATDDDVQEIVEEVGDLDDDVQIIATKLEDIIDDDVLSQDEKPSIISDYDVILADQPGLNLEAVKYGITTEKDNYNTAITALTNYLNTLTTPVDWDDLSGSTDITPGLTFRAKFEDVYTYTQTLQNKIYNDAKDLADEAKEVADIKVQTFYEDLADIPTSVSVGDLWVETDNKNKLYRAAIVGADQIAVGEWEVSQDGTIADAQDTADSKIQTYYADAAPTAITVGDIWIDTDDPDNATYRWDGVEWVRYDLPVNFPSDDGLLAHYSLDDGQGVGGAIATYHLDDSSLDLSGSGIHGTDTDITYVPGQGAEFDGSTSTIDLGTELQDRLVGTDQVSVSAWINLDGSMTVTRADIFNLGDNVFRLNKK